MGVVSFSRFAFSRWNDKEGITILTAYDQGVCNKWDVPHQKIQSLRIVPSRQPDERDFEMKGQDQVIDLR